MSGSGQKEVLFNSSEAVGQLDLNNLQRFLRAVQIDWLTAAAGSFTGVGTDKSSSAAEYDRTVALYCMGDSGAPFPDTATPLRINNLAGPIIQWKTGPLFPLSSGTPPTNWGTDIYGLTYWLDFKELQTTHDAGDPSNPRWDLVCVKLSDVDNDPADQESRLQKQVVSGEFIISAGTFVKRRKVTLTKQVIKGTPAVTPLMPSVPSGFMPYYAVRVPASFNAVFPVDNNFHDYRMPLGSFAIDAPAMSGIYNGNGLPTLPQSGVFFPATIDTDSFLDLYPQLPIPQSSCRLVGVGHLIGHTFGFPPVITLARYNASGFGSYNLMGGNSFWELTTLEGSTVVGGTPTSSDLMWDDQRIFGVGSDMAGNSPPTANAKPPWGTGWPSGYASRQKRHNPSSVSVNLYDTIGVRYLTQASASQVLAFVRFYFAGMLY